MKESDLEVGRDYRLPTTENLSPVNQSAITVLACLMVNCEVNKSPVMGALTTYERYATPRYQIDHDRFAQFDQLHYRRNGSGDLSLSLPDDDNTIALIISDAAGKVADQFIFVIDPETLTALVCHGYAVSEETLVKDPAQLQQLDIFWSQLQPIIIKNAYSSVNALPDTADDPDSPFN